MEVSLNAPANVSNLIPETGVIIDFENESYHALQHIVSNSQLQDFARSPAHCYGLHFDPERPPREVKSGQLEGTLAHCATLEPEQFLNRYTVTPHDAPRKPTQAQWDAKKPSPESVESMRWWTEWNTLNAHRTTISHELYHTALAQAESVRALPEVAQLFDNGAPEVSVFWIDPLTRLRCRARPDYVHRVDASSVILMDVKTYSDASKAAFKRQIENKGYYRQAAHYSDGYELATGLKVRAFIFVAVETSWPFEACALMLDTESLDAGRRENRELLERFAECKRTGVWPGYSERIEIVRLSPRILQPQQDNQWQVPA